MEHGGQIEDDGIWVSNLGSQPFLPMDVFREVISLLKEEGGRAAKGNARGQGVRLGDLELPPDSVEGIVAHKVYGIEKGKAVTARITPISCILEWARICKNEPGYLVLTLDLPQIEDYIKRLRDRFEGYEKPWKIPYLKKRRGKEDFTARLTRRQGMANSRRSVTQLPSTMVISPETRYLNEAQLRDILRHCEEFVWWVDPYFYSLGLDQLVLTIDASMVRELRILSGTKRILPAKEVDKKETFEREKKRFKKFREEMQTKGVSAEWRVWTVKQDFSHDRFILTKTFCYTAQSIDTIGQGTYSQMHLTSQRPPFQVWWEAATSIEDFQA